MADEDDAAIGDLVRRARRAANFSQEELAARADLSVRGISDIERGVIQTPHKDTIELLADALDLSPAERRNWERQRRLHARRTTPPANIATTVPVPPSLPTPLSTFIGRDRDVAEVGQLLMTSRVVTVTGPGGVGKTRVAIAVGYRLTEQFPDGVIFVDLAPIREPSVVVPTIATTLGVRESGAVPLFDTFVMAVRSRQVLLILDNLEQVIEAAADIARLVSACPTLSILVTSREPMRIGGETHYPLAPLPLPFVEDNVIFERLCSNPSVELFIQRARAGTPGFALTPENVEAIVAVCRRLEGLPLAIELAAARMRLLSPQSLHERLHEPLQVLTGGARDLPDRQRTMRDTIAWSYDLLTEAEQRLLRRLSVFVGGWTLDAAEELAADDDPDVLTTLDGLITASLVTMRDLPDGTVRYVMLETIRQFGRDVLAEADEALDVRRRHAAYVLNLVKRAHADLLWHIGEIAIWLDRFEVEHDNVRAALAWANETGDVAYGLRVVGTFWKFWFERGYLTEGRGWIEPLLAQVEPSRTELRVLPLIGSGAMGVYLGEFDSAASRLEEALGLSSALGDCRAMVIANLFLGQLSALRPEPDLLRAQVLFEEALAISRENDLPRHITTMLNNLGVVARMAGDLDVAATRFSEALEHARERNDTVEMPTPLGNLGDIARARHDDARALTFYQEALRAGRATRKVINVADNLEGVAHTLLNLGHVETAVRLFSAVHAIRTRTHMIGMAADDTAFANSIDDARLRSGEAAFAAAWQSGVNLSVDEAIDIALAVDVDTLPAHLGKRPGSVTS